MEALFRITPSVSVPVPSSTSAEVKYFSIRRNETKPKVKGEGDDRVSGAEDEVSQILTGSAVNPMSLPWRTETKVSGRAERANVSSLKTLCAGGSLSAI